MRVPETRNPPGMAGSQNAISGGGLQSDYSASPAQRLLPHLHNVRETKSGHWRADCPNAIHDSGRAMLSVTERHDLLLVHCFGCHDAPAILGAVGLTLADLYDRPINPTPQQRREARQAVKRGAWASALRVIEREGLVVLLAGCDAANGIRPSAEDHARLVTALERITDAREVLA